MLPAIVSAVGAVNSSPVVLDYMTTPFQVSIAANVVSGSVSYKLQYTYEDPFQSGGIPSTSWIDHGLMTGKTAAFDTVINAAPVTALRLVNAGTGTVRAIITQGG